MQDLEQINYKAIKPSSKKSKTELDYISPLGNFSWTQERLILFGKGKHIATLFFIHLALSAISIIMSIQAFGVDMTFVENGQTVNLNWLKMLYVLIIGASLINPFIYGSIFIGAKRHNLRSMERGIKWLRFFAYLGLVLLVISAVIFGIGMLTLLFRAFILVVLLAGIVGFFLWIYFKFLTKLIDVLDSIIAGLNTKKTYERSNVPDAIGLRPYLYGFLVLQLIGLIPAGDQAVETGNNALDTLMSNLDMFSGLQSFVSLAISIIIIVMIGKFEEHMRKRPPGAIIKPASIPDDVNTPSYSGKSIFKD